MTVLLTAKQVAAMLQVPTTWVYGAAREGLLPSVQCGRYRRFHQDDVDHWIDDQRAASSIGSNQQRPRTASTAGGMAQGDVAP